MASVLKHFGAHIFWWATEWIRLLSVRYVFRETEVRYFDMTFYVYKNILRFDISVYDIFGMKVLYTKDYLREIKSGKLLREPLKVV